MASRGSDRVYRSAWTPERAFGLLEEESDAYDQTVVAALKRCVGGELPTWVANVTPAAAPVVVRTTAPRAA